MYKNIFSVHANSEEVEAYACIHRLLHQISVFRKKKSSQLVRALHSLLEEQTAFGCDQHCSVDQWSTGVF